MVARFRAAVSSHIETLGDFRREKTTMTEEEKRFLSKLLKALGIDPGPEGIDTFERIVELIKEAARENGGGRHFRGQARPRRVWNGL